MAGRHAYRMLPAVRQALGLSVYPSFESCQPHAWQLYRHISVHAGDNDSLAGRFHHQAQHVHEAHDSTAWPVASSRHAQQLEGLSAPFSC